MQSNNELVLIGRIGAPHGIRGWVKVHSFTEEPEDIFNYLKWNISYSHNKEIFEAEFEEYREHQAGFVVKLAHIEDRDEVAKLTNSNIYVPRNQLPELAEDQYYWHDLIGLQVFNAEQLLGVVFDFMNTGANDIMVVKDANNKKILIPYIVDMYIQQVDMAKRCIKVEWSLED